MKKNDVYLEQLREEFVNEFCSQRGGNFTRKDLEDGFTDGYYNREAPKKYHAFLAWQAGRRHGGHCL